MCRRGRRSAGRATSRRAKPRSSQATSLRARPASWRDILRRDKRASSRGRSRTDMRLPMSKAPPPSRTTKGTRDRNTLRAKTITSHRDTLPARRRTARTVEATTTSAVRRPASPLALGLRLRLVLTLTAVAIFPIAFASYVIVRDEVGSVTRNIAFETRDAAVGTQARFLRRLDRRELAAVAAASSTRRQTAIHRHETATLRKFALSRGLLLEVHGRRYGRPLSDAITARVQLESGGRPIGSVVAQLPVDSATLQQVTAPHAPGVRLAFTDERSAGSTPPGRGLTLPLSSRFGIRGYLP